MKYTSVTEVVRRIKDDIQKDFRLQSIAMEGNIIGLKRASNGHYYMNIHDDHCSIRAILFRSRVGRMMDHIREGDHVVVIGSINVYEKGGALSFIIERLFSQGIGSLQAQYEKIKNELEQAGYFDPSHRKAIPRFPWTVGVLTSRTGAVLHDICKIAAERNPYVIIRLFPIPVQGEGAEAAIASAVERAGKRRDLDVLILARGGGSMEDLWCFNSPDVVKAIYHATVPIITAIGHETDTTLADYAADVRAATPTHAAELAFSDIEEIEMELADMSNQAYERLMSSIEAKRQDMAALTARMQPRRYGLFLTEKQRRIEQIVETGSRRLHAIFAEKGGQVAKLQASLQALNPAALVRRGYGQLEQNGSIVSDMQQLDASMPLQIQLVDGDITTEIKEVNIYGKSDG